MILQTDGLDKIDLSIHNILRRLTRQHPDNHTDKPLGDHRIAVRRKFHLAIDNAGMQPYFRLASFDQVIVSLVLGIDQGQLLTELNNKFVLLHPVAKELKIGDDLILLLFNGHYLKFSSPMLIARSPCGSPRPAGPSPPVYYKRPKMPSPSRGCRTDP